MKRLIILMAVGVTMAVVQCTPLRADTKTEPSLNTMLSGTAYIIGIVYVAHHLSPKSNAAPKKVEQPFDIRSLISPEAKKVVDDLSTAALKGAVAIFCTKK